MQYVLNRLNEKTTWAGIFAAAAGILGATFTPELVSAGTAAGVGLAGLLLVLFKETEE